MIYVNNATTSYPKPPGVIESINRALVSVPYDPGRGNGNGTDVIADCRRKLIGLINADDPCRVILTSGTTYALNYAIMGCMEFQSITSTIFPNCHQALAMFSIRKYILRSGTQGLIRKGADS